MISRFCLTYSISHDSFAKYLMPQNEEDEAEVLVQAGYAGSKEDALEGLKNHKLRRLLDETSDFIERYEFFG
jgi:hypothetical protein